MELDLKGAVALYNAAVAALPEPLRFAKPAGEALAELEPSPKLAALVKKSRELAVVGADIEDE